jgi:hypothetical protein
MLRNKNAVIDGGGGWVGGAVARACLPELRPVIASPCTGDRRPLCRSCGVCIARADTQSDLPGGFYDS